MQTTRELWQMALTKHHAAEWARRLNLTPSALSIAKRQGRLSPVLAANVAIELGEDATRWTAIAALEGAVKEQGSPLLARAERAVKDWRKR